MLVVVHHRDVQLLDQPGLNVGYLAFNTTKKPFDDVRVRKALSMAINKQAIVDAVFQGAATPAKNPIPPTMWSYNEEIEDDPYDPEAAKQMLEEAGVTDLSMKVWAMPVQRPYMPNARRTAEMMQEDLSKVGVNVEIRPPGGAWIGPIRPGEVLYSPAADHYDWFVVLSGAVEVTGHFKGREHLSFPIAPRIGPGWEVEISRRLDQGRFLPPKLRQPSLNRFIQKQSQLVVIEIGFS